MQIDFENPNGKGEEIRPIMKDLGLRVLRMGHPVISLVSQNTKVLLFDYVLVDSVFHGEDDPLSPFYMSLDQVVDRLTQELPLVNDAASSIQQIGDLFTQFAGTFQEYEREMQPMPSELIEKLITGIAQAYRTLAFEGQVEILSLAAKAAEKQARFIENLQHTGKAQEIERARVAYNGLYQVLQRTSEAAHQASGNYDMLIEKYFVGRPGFPKFGEMPTWTEPQDTLKRFLKGVELTGELATRPMFKRVLHLKVRQAYSDLSAALTEIQVSQSQRGEYSTRPDLR